MFDKILSPIVNLIDDLWTSDEEKLETKVILEKLKLEIPKVQAEINKMEAGHRSIFVAGWRPFIGWVCGVGLAYDFLTRPLLVSFGVAAPDIDASSLYPLIAGMLGLGGLRTFEKVKGFAK